MQEDASIAGGRPKDPNRPPVIWHKGLSICHWKRFMEEFHACEHAIELRQDLQFTARNVRTLGEPKTGRGVGCVEVPRGTLMHDYLTDENGLVSRVSLFLGTTHNLGPIHMSVNQAARTLIRDGHVDQGTPQHDRNGLSRLRPLNLLHHSSPGR